MQHFIEQKRHLGMDIEEYFSVIHKYLKEQENINEDILNKAEAIEKFLKEKLELELNDKTSIFKSKQGVNFCGYKINEYRIKVRDKGKRRFKKKVKKLLNQIEENNISSKEARKYLTGHIGYFSIANTYELKKRNILLQEDLISKKII